MSEEELKIEAQINALKYKLLLTDYQAIKYGEGEMSFEEYYPVKEQRRLWRQEINSLEERLKTYK